MIVLILKTLQLAALLAWPIVALLLPVTLRGIPVTLQNVVAAFATRMLPAFLAIFVLLCTFVIIHSIIGNRIRSAKKRGILALFVTLGGPALWIVYQVNKNHLPEFFEAPSVLSNLAMLLAFIVLVMAGAAGLSRWMRSIERSRTMPSFVTALVLLLAAIAPIPLALGMRANAGPNVIILLVDALRYDHLSCYGYDRPTSKKNIDRLAADSIVFEQAISSSGFTKTSTASLFTGLAPHQHGVYWGDLIPDEAHLASDVLDPQHDTLAESLRDAGFTNVAWSHNPQIQDYMGFAQGFAKYEDFAGTIRQISESFMDWYNDFGRYTKFFTYMHYMDLHDPYRPPAHLDDLYGESAELYSELDFSNYLSWANDWSRILGQIRNGKRTISAADVRQLTADYDELIHAVDEDLGGFLDQLRNCGAYDKSIIILTADHGDGFMEHGFISHSTTPYDELVRVPLIIKLPESAHAGTRIAQQVGTVQLAETISDLVGAKSQNGARAPGFTHLLRVEGSDNAHGPEHTFVESAEALGIRTESWKVLYFVFQSRWEIYDLSEDPGEQHDLSASPPPDAAHLQALILEALIERENRQAGTVPLDEATIDALRSLGYIE